jgi:hypothetical protein
LFQTIFKTNFVELVFYANYLQERFYHLATPLNAFVPLVASVMPRQSYAFMRGGTRKHELGTASYLGGNG